MLTFRKILPSSIATPYKGEYEYLLVWISTYGGVRQWLFSSTDGERKESFKSEIIDNNTTFRNIPNAQSIAIEMMTTSLSNDDFEYVASIFESPRIYLVDKSGEKTQVAINGAKKKKKRTIKGFDLSFTIALQEPYLMNV